MGLKEDLLRPEAFESVLASPSFAIDAPRDTSSPRKVEIIETHISWVFLLENDVFKVKKPVSLGFLDFRTKEQRQGACEAEVRLNRRLSKDIYLGVVPIVRGSDGRARVSAVSFEAPEGPAGAEVIDWAVHMSRVPETQRADVLLAGGTLDSAALDSVAKTIAEFHDSNPGTERTGAYGLPSTLEQNLEENFAQTRATIEDYLRPESAEQLRLWQRSFLRGHAKLFEERAARGRVRDGHGDLRLEHVYLDIDEDAVTVLDCIEFNERFRFGDVAADVAFLSMDLAGHGRVDLAERFLAAYARESNDFDLYSVVDFYESYRAFVRGKVAAMLAEDETAGESTRIRAAKEARRYYLLAEAVSRRSLLLPSVVAVGGIIASGKSTIASLLGEAMSAPVVDADRTRKAMLGVAPSKRLDEAAWTGAYDPKFTEHVYEEVLRRADVVLASGRPVVIDASFRSAAMRDAARELASRHNVPFRFVECRTPAEVCRSRLETRSKHRGVSDGRIAIFDDFCARFEGVRELVETEHIVLDTTLPIQSNERELRSVLDVWPKGLDA